MLFRLFDSRTPFEVIGKAINFLRREGFIALAKTAWTLYLDQRFADYHKWALRFTRPGNAERKSTAQRMSTFSSHPVFMVLILTNAATNPSKLERTTQSLKKQIYPHWKLAFLSPDQGLRALPDVRTSPSIPFDQTLRCSTKFASSECITLASSNCDYVTFINAGDELSPVALYIAAQAIQENAEPHVLYSDEDRIDENDRHTTPIFKPDWDSELFLTANYLGNFSALHIPTLFSLGGFDWVDDLTATVGEYVLRLIRANGAPLIRHLPYVLYHSRHHSSRAETEKCTLVAFPPHSQSALQAHLDTVMPQAVTTTDALGRLYIRFPLPTNLPLVSIIIPTRNAISLLRQCLQSIFALTSYGNYEIVIVNNQSDDPETIAYMDSLANAGKARVLQYDAPFNYSAINNLAVNECRGSILCLLNNDVEVICSTWLTEMTSHAIRPDIGAVGAMLYFPDDTIQHAGVIIGMSGCADHWYSGTPRYHPLLPERVKHVQSISAVTGACLVIRKEIFHEVGGFDADNLPIAFNDIDLCLKIKEKGYRNLFTPFAELYHYESATRGQDNSPEKQNRLSREVDYMRHRWGHLMQSDPSFNPNLSLLSKTPVQCSSPRTTMLR